MTVVYSKPQCVQCDRTMKVLDSRGVDYRTVDITESAEALKYIKSLGYLQAPVVMVDEDNHWSGFRPDKLNEHFTVA